MFIDLDKVGTLEAREADVCIIGSGPAGIAVAVQLLEHGCSVCLLESGDFNADRDIQHLADGDVIDRPGINLKHERNRQFGGSSHSWAGSCAPMSPSDFEDRPWLGIKGWPYTFDELLSYYTRAQGLLELGPYAYQSSDWLNGNSPFLPFSQDLLENRIWQLCQRTNFSDRYIARFSQSSRAQVILNATATEIMSDERRKVVTGIKIQSLKGVTAYVRAKAYVLACGGIDNARMLLLSRDHYSNALGNEYDIVGRYFMQHPHVGAASVQFEGTRRWQKSYKYRNHGHVCTRAWVGMTRHAQQRHRVLNPVATFINRFIADSLTHAQSIGYSATKRLLLQASRGRLPKHLQQEIFNIASDMPGIVTGCWQHLRHKSGALYIMAEQVPDEKSRVTLSQQRDVFGLEQSQIDWRLAPVDKRSIRVMVKLIDQELRRLGCGHAIPDTWLTVDESSWPERVTGGYHHMGTTRMGTNPKDSVVDPHARVHNVENLYVAGSSIFPTVGSANPTLTIVATSLKLADHLANRLTVKSGYAITGNSQMPAVTPCKEGMLVASEEKMAHG